MAAAASGAVAPVPPPSPGDSVAAQLCRACKLGDAEAAARLLDKLGDPDVSDARGSTPLMHAAWHGHLSVIKVLLERGCNPNARNARQNTALHFAHEAGHKVIQDYLMQNGAAKSATYRNCLGLLPGNLTPSHYLIESPERHTAPLVDTVLETVFLSIVGNRATMSVAHELPVALRVLGLHWTVELGEALEEHGVQAMLDRCRSVSQAAETGIRQGSTTNSHRFLVPASALQIGDMDKRIGVATVDLPGGPDAPPTTVARAQPGQHTAPAPPKPTPAVITNAMPPPVPTTSAPLSPASFRVRVPVPASTSLKVDTPDARKPHPTLRTYERVTRAHSHGVQTLDFATFSDVCFQLKRAGLTAHAPPPGASRWGGTRKGMRVLRNASMDARHFQASMAASALNRIAQAAKASKAKAASRGATPIAGAGAGGHAGASAQAGAGAGCASDRPPAPRATGTENSALAASAGDVAGAGAGAGAGANPGAEASSTTPAAGAAGADTAQASPPAAGEGAAAGSSGAPTVGVNDVNHPQVFLGGACNPTTWRHDIAIPQLAAAGITFFNPQVDEWHPGLVAIEATAKLNASIILFVVGAQTRGVASMVEASEFVSSGRQVVLVLKEIPKDARMNGVPMSPGELKDINRGRTYLHDVARRHKCVVYSNVQDAVSEIIRRWRVGGSFTPLPEDSNRGHVQAS